MTSFLAALLVLGLPAGLAGQQEAAAADTASVDEVVLVFLDCPHWLCDFDYVRRELPFVTWVRDRQVADVHLLVTEQDTGGGGNLFTLDFIGREDFDGLERRLTVSTDPTESEAEERQELVRVMALGLSTYAAETPAGAGLRVTYEEAGAEETGQRRTRIQDPWNRWVFDVDLGGGYSSEARVTSGSFNGGLSANRTTEEWKIDLGVGGRYSQRRFEVGDGEEFLSIQRDFGFQSLAVKSLGEHWSVGGQGSVRHSTRLNQDLTIRGGPAVEYNVFPYSESTRRQLTFLYAVSGVRFDYDELTVFEETSELRSTQTLNVSLDVQEQWGELNLSLEGLHYLQEIQQNRVTFSGRVELQLVQGLSFDIFGSASRVRDQIYLPAEEASDEEILVGQREFATDFETRVRIGLSYTFGSIYSDVVNPRFDSFDGGGDFF